MFNPWWCFACLLCGGAPDWPQDGVANREWVVDAIEWRLQRGPDGCTDQTPAIDAWTLEWIANSPEVRVDIVTEDWPVFTEKQRLQGTLIQIMALEQLNGVEHNPKRCLKTLNKYAKRSGKVWDKELEKAFELNKEIIKKNLILK
ncbi:MAG: hypothetical protein CL823_06390 [Crocinitomicaceae bacterium]|nr:hypothetical protein [Crocinitomicaceae bacterium]|tara:strand:+ start:1069 stop:1503 length:435 start_codon:yes stop_codon:yes gene_type:complete